MRIDIWVDVVCPWCYIGKRRFENALAQFPERDSIEVLYHSFELDPTTPRDSRRPTVEVLGAKYGRTPAQVKEMMSNVEQVAAGEDLDYHLELTESGNSRDAHRVIHLARERGLQSEVMERLFRAYFSEGKSLFDHETLTSLAAEAGLDAAEVRAVLEADTYESDVIADEREARSLGISGVPFFVVDGRYGISGAQPTALFSQALTQAWSEHLTPAQANR